MRNRAIELSQFASDGCGLPGPGGSPGQSLSRETPPGVSAGGPPAALSAAHLEWAGKRGGRAAASQQTFCRQSSGCRVGRITGRKPLSVFDSNHVPHLEATQRSQRTAAATPPPSIRKARAFGHGSQPMLVLGHHQAEGAGQMELFLPVRGAGHLQPLRGGLDGGHSRKFFAGQDADRTKLRPAANRLGTTDFARRPGTVDEIQGTGFAASRSGRHSRNPTPGPTCETTIPTRSPSSRP